MITPSFPTVSGPKAADPPTRLASGCQRMGLSGMVWLDSAVAGPASVSLVAACPAFLRRGTAADWHSFASGCEKFQRMNSGGAVVGWVEYEGAFHFGFYPQPALYSHDTGLWSYPGGEPGWLESVQERETSNRAWRTPLSFTFETAREEFCRRVELAQAHISAGNIYQVNLTHRATAKWPLSGDPFSLYLKLRSVSPAPQAAYLALDGTRTVLSSSPEEFLHMDGRRIKTRPIKGTRPRGKSRQRDENAIAELLASEKEKAELLMITDLLRNDLGQICEYGSVQVTELFRVEQFAQVFHLVSTIEGRLRADVTHPEALRICSPGGSITGAPKRRAREVIACLENRPRGLYTGAIGVFLPGQESRFNIAIRTLLVEDGKAHFHVGAGIVADSDPEKEWEETLHKAAGILHAARV